MGLVLRVSKGFNLEGKSQNPRSKFRGNSNGQTSMQGGDSPVPPGCRSSDGFFTVKKCGFKEGKDFFASRSQAQLYRSAKGSSSRGRGRKWGRRRRR